MNMELISIETSGSMDRLVTVKLTPSWFARAFLGEIEKEVQYVGYRRYWRRLPDLHEFSMFASEPIMLQELVERDALRTRLKQEGRIK